MSQGLPDLSPQQQLSKPEFAGEWVKLGDCFPYIKNGYNVKQDKGMGGIPITRIETLSGGRFNRDRVGYANILSTDGIEDRILQDGDILMSHINSPQFLGRAVMYQAKPDDCFIHGMNLLCLRADRQKIDPAYAAVYFQTQTFKRQVNKIAKKSVNQASFSTTSLKDLTIPICSLRNQREFADRFAGISILMDGCRNQLSALDDLVKSQFVEIVSASKFSKESVRLGDIGAFQTGGTPSRSHSEYYGGQIPWISTPALNGSVIDASDANEGITQLGVDNSATKVIPAGSLMVGIRVGVGKVAINAVPMCTNQDIVSISGIDSAKWSVTYLSHAIQGQSERLRAQKRGATITGVTTKALKELQITRCSIQEQQQFADFVAKVDKLGFDCCRMTTYCDTVFSSVSARLLCT